jgi:dTDP-glucose pyrophosphorylase
MNELVIIPAGGLATRMHPLSKGISKCMISMNKPIICWIIDSICQNFNNPHIIIVDNGSGDIKKFVTNFYKNKNIKIDFTTQPKPLGPLNAIETGINFFERNYTIEKNTNLCIWLSDTIVLDHKIDKSSSNLVVSKVSDWNRWCLVDEKTNQFFDKPETNPGTDLALVGIYYFKSLLNVYEILNNQLLLEEKNEISILLKEYNKIDRFKIQKIDNWCDCGELNTYYQSRAKLLKRLTRKNNELDIDLELSLVKKTAKNKESKEKLFKELKWYQNANMGKYFIPKIYNTENEHECIKMSLEPGITISELYLYENITLDSWKTIFDKFFNINFKILFNNDQLLIEEIKEDNQEMFFKKINNRLEQIKKIIDISDEDLKFWEYCVDKMKNYYYDNNLDRFSTREMHGDLHWSNILFDSQMGKMIFLDPRGSWGNKITNSGNVLYDIAKFYQDPLLHYNEIINKYYEKNDERYIFYKEQWSEQIISVIDDSLLKYLDKNTINFVKLYCAILVLTCIPFHYEDIERCKSFYNIAFNFMNKTIEELC